MKLSEFLQEKKVKFINGEIEIIQPDLNGEVVFYNLDEKRIKLINDEVIQKLDKNDNDETLAYKIFSYLICIENDVDYDTFIKMVDFPPNNQFAVIVDQFVSSMEDLFNKAETKNKTTEKATRLKDKIPQIEKSKQEIRNELLQELGKLQENTPENKKRRKELFQELAELED